MSPLERLHRVAQGLRSAIRPARVDPGPPLRTEARLYGVRGLYRPTMALQTMARLGPVRHALAQRAISGILQVHAPWADDIAQGERMPGEKKKAPLPRRGPPEKPPR